MNLQYVDLTPDHPFCIYLHPADMEVWPVPGRRQATSAEFLSVYPYAVICGGMIYSSPDRIMKESGRDYDF